MSKISEVLLRVFNKVSRNEKTPKNFGVDQLLHPSEIHMIMFIGNNEGVHISELSRIVGVTRGAVSQVVAKLEKKGFVKKIEAPDNNLKTIPALTSKGHAAYWAHQQHHEQIDAELCDFVKKLSEDQVNTIVDFLQHLENMADKNH